MAPPSKTTPGVVPIPEPPSLPFVGHITEFKTDGQMDTFSRLHNQHGDIFRLRFPGGKTVVLLGSYKLVNEICDQSRFQKSISADILEIRNATHDGLFTAAEHEPNWGIAHRILMPAFGPTSIRGMFDDMHDIASQLALKWARHGPSHPIEVTEDLTRLALDTIALCSMDFRFNSFYSERLHPFVQAMGDFLIESGRRYMRPSFTGIFFRAADRKFFGDIDLLRRTADEVIQARKDNPDAGKRRDLLTAMMEGVDPRTGQKLTDSSITDNLITFLIAGHETTSGTLSFAFYRLLKHPETYQKAQKEVDEVIGRGPVTVDNITKLHYLAAVLRETLRHSSPIPGIALEPLQDTLLNGKYPVSKGEAILPNFSKSHLDPSVFGADATEFIPERMTEANFDKLQKEFPNCWKPFGNGKRACIGRAFAWQESLLALAVLLQNFNFQLHDPSYNLLINETITIKPKDFHMRATLRHGMTPLDLERRLSGKMIPDPSSSGLGGVGKHAPTSKYQVIGSSGKSAVSIFFGSASGTCEALAHRLAANAGNHGFVPVVVESLDAAKENLPLDHPVVLLTSSLEGNPPYNAAHFVAWLKSLQGEELKGVSYAVFGAGNREWTHSFHRIPKLVNEKMEAHGAERLVEMGLNDASDKDPFSDFESWEDDVLWPALRERYPPARRTTSAESGDDTVTAAAAAAAAATAPSTLSVEITVPRTSTLRQDVQEAVVTGARTLTAPDVPVKRQLEVKLPTGTSYRAGDYLAVLPLNPRDTVARVFRRFGLSWDAVLTIKGGDRRLPLPTDQPTPAWDVLSAYVELSQPATKRNFTLLADATPDKETKEQLLAAFSEGKKVSVLDVMEMFPDIQIPIGTFLHMLPPMRIRQYSISSSPLRDPSHISLTYSVLQPQSQSQPQSESQPDPNQQPSLAPKTKHIGVASTYLASLQPGDKLHVSIRPSNLAFHLPHTPESTPIICIAAGSGLAPFRGFLQERAVQLSAGRTLAPALLLFGCRGPADDLYREELDAWEREGAVTVKRAYSRREADTEGCRYVQDRLAREREIVYELWARGAKLFVCGSRAVGIAVQDGFVRLLMDKEGVGEEEARSCLEENRNERFATDVFD